MRKILIVFVILISIFNYAQSGNRFLENENITETKKSWDNEGNGYNAFSEHNMIDEDDPGNPPNPSDLPVDEYIFLLFLAAVVIIIVSKNRNTKLI